MRAREMAGQHRLFRPPRVGEVEAAIDHEHAARRGGEPFREVRAEIRVV